MSSHKRNANTRYIPTKNYILTVCIIIFIIFITLYIVQWFKVKSSHQLNTHYLITSNTINQAVDEIDEIDDILMESPSYYFVFIGYTNDQTTYNLEKKIKSTIDNYNLSDNFYLIDATNMANQSNYLKTLNDKLKLKNTIKKLPIILYFENNEFQKSVTTVKEFKDLIKLYHIDEISQ